MDVYLNHHLILAKLIPHFLPFNIILKHDQDYLNKIFSYLHPILLLSYFISSLNSQLFQLVLISVLQIIISCDLFNEILTHFFKLLLLSLGQLFQLFLSCQLFLSFLLFLSLILILFICLFIFPFLVLYRLLLLSYLLVLLCLLSSPLLLCSMHTTILTSNWLTNPLNQTNQRINTTQLNSKI